MVDYYTELEIAQSLGLDEIKQSLARLSKVYEKRDADGFESARKKLVLISEAETVFKTESTRKQYDRELVESKNAPIDHADPMEERKAQFQQWLNKASEYYQSGQYDAAKKAVDRAFRNVSPNDDNAELYGLAAEIYRMNGDLKAALDYVVEALILDEENVSSHITKFHIYEGLEKSNYSDKANYNLHKRREILANAEQYANKNGNVVDRARIYDLLSHTWYDGGRGDVTKAMSYAVSAIQLFPEAANARDVLAKIEKAQRIEAEREQQKRDAEEEQQRQQRESEAFERTLSEARTALNKDIHAVKQTLISLILQSLKTYPDEALKAGKPATNVFVKKKFLGMDVYDRVSSSSYKRHQGWHVCNAKVKYYKNDYRAGRCFAASNGRFYVQLFNNNGHPFYTELKNINEIAENIFNGIVSPGKNEDYLAMLYKAGKEAQAVTEYFKNL